MQPRYLFIRVLEACNAGCYMCGYANSTDRYRFDPQTLRALLARAAPHGLEVVRFTGGEPLLHRNILELIETVKECGVSCSMITNGALLPRFSKALATAGLDQVIVSIDGASAETHDRIRRTPGLFRAGIEGLSKCAELGMRTRVNTVCGPNNYAEMPALQDTLTAMEVAQWELSALKLERPIAWSAQDRTIAETEVVPYVYGDVSGRRLRPMGTIWCGVTPQERDRYFREGIPPRPHDSCRIVRLVRYLDARNWSLYPCSLLPHRPSAADAIWAAPPAEMFTLSGSSIESLANHFSVKGPEVCTGCSATAAGVSDEMKSGAVERWMY